MNESDPRSEAPPVGIVQQPHRHARHVVLSTGTVAATGIMVADAAPLVTLAGEIEIAHESDRV